MEHIAIQLPDKVGAYIQEHCPGHRLVCAREDRDGKGQLFYLIDFLHDDNYHHLKITGTGIVINEELEPQFLNDHHEQYF